MQFPPLYVLALTLNMNLRDSLIHSLLQKEVAFMFFLLSSSSVLEAVMLLVFPTVTDSLISGPVQRFFFNTVLFGLEQAKKNK